MRCSICSGEHKYSECSAAVLKCPNCGGSYSANEKIYLHVLQIKNLICSFQLISYVSYSV